MSHQIAIFESGKRLAAKQKGCPNCQQHWRGLLLCGLTAIFATILGGSAWPQSHGISTLTIAIVLGMAVGNAAYPRFPGLAATCGSGVAFSKQTLLRLGVVLYGLRLTMQDVGTVGVPGVLIDAAILTSTFTLSTFVGTRWLGMDRKDAMLIGAGSSICGAAAIMAAEPVVRARAEQVTVAVATVVLFGTVSIFLYPALFQLNSRWQLLPGGEGTFGIYIGSTVHEVAQVVATARSIGPHAADTAVIAKMVRVIMLAPFLIGLSVWLTRGVPTAAEDPGGGAQRSHTPLAIPWFALGFIIVVIVNSLRVVPASLRDLFLEIDSLLLAMAMAALGISTHFRVLRQAGARPLLLALFSFAWLVIAGGAINRWFPELIARL